MDYFASAKKREANKKYYLKNREKLLEAQKAYNKKHYISKKDKWVEK